MLAFSAWWERTARALIALSLAVLVLGPSLDVVLCQDEAATTVTAQAVAGQHAGDLATGDDAQPASEDPSQHPDGLCSHGHCHHGGPYLLASLELSDDSAAAARQHGAAPATAADSLPPSGLERPPRA